MGGLFSACMREPNHKQEPLKANTKQLSEADMNLAKLKNIRQEFVEKERACDMNVSKSHEEVLSLMHKGKKEQAKYALQRQKLYEGYQVELMKKSGIIENTILEYNKTKMDKGLVEALQGAQKLIRDINNSIDMNVVVEAIDDANELSNRHDEMSKLLDAYNLNQGVDLDEELRQIEQENLQKDFSQVGKVNVKNVPTQEVNQQPKQTHKSEHDLDNKMEALLN